MRNLHKGDVIDGDSSRKYSVLRKLGEGQFAEVWEVRLSDGVASKFDVKYALKLEKRKDRSTVKQEYKALKKLSGTCDQVVAVEGFGMYDERFYMVLQLLGETLFEARKQSGGRFDLPTVKAVGLSTLAAIQQVHEQQIIHRDIKPANFVINPPNAAPGRGAWLLIDFGLARRYTDDVGSHLPRRTDASFRGSTTYASVHAHRDEDLSRRDDLWSWMYMIIELIDGEGPARVMWVLLSRCDQAGEGVKRVDAEAFSAISGHLRSLSFADTPDYAFLRSCLQQLPDHPPPQLRELPALVTHTLQQEQPANGQFAGPMMLSNAGSHHLLQQQQQDVLLTPASPPWEQSPAQMAAAVIPQPPVGHRVAAAAAAGAAAAASSKRARSGSTAELAEVQEQDAKRQRANSNQAPPRRSGM
eukprot:gene9220-9385_t